MRTLQVVVVMLVVAFAAVTAAGPNVSVKVAVHVLAHDEMRTCLKLFPVITGCADIVTTYTGCGDIDIFPVYYDLVEYGAVQYGLTWPSEWGTCAFHSCSDNIIYHFDLYGDPGAFDPGDAVGQTWIGCYSGPVLVPAWGTLSATTAGLICMIGHIDLDPFEPQIRNCGFQEVDVPVSNVCAGACGAFGCDPCYGGPSATEERAWGSIKELFR
jgi:hypothetical protein